jgi:hypothetical protein
MTALRSVRQCGRSIVSAAVIPVLLAFTIVGQPARAGSPDEQRAADGSEPIERVERLAVVVPPGVGGRVCFDASVPVHVIADVNGWFNTDN